MGDHVGRTPSGTHRRAHERPAARGRLVLASLLTLLVVALAGGVAVGLAAAPVGGSGGAGGSASLSASGSGAATGRASRIPARPNIVTIMADDMRYDDLRFAPHVRQLFARGGTQFRNSFSSYPLCCPARASFLTGELAHNHHVYSHVDPYGFKAFDDSRTVATTLHRAGYRTAFVGKYLNGYGAQRSKVSGRPSYTWVPPGWDQWFGAVERPDAQHTPGGTYNYMRTVYNINGRPSGRRFHGEYQTDTLGRFARNLAHGFSRGERPFFLYLSFVAPHHGGPREPDDPRSQRLRGRPVEYPTPARPQRVKGYFDRTVQRGPGVPPGRAQPDPRTMDMPWFLRRPPFNAHDRAAVAEVTRQRAEAVRVLDQQVGRLIDQLRRDGTLDETVVMFTSDNGYFLGEHQMRGGKILAHEPSLRVPFLVRGPGVPTGQRRWSPVTTVDQTATILDLAGATRAHPLPLDGRSILPDVARDRGWDQALLDEALLEVVPRKDQAFRDPRSSIGIRTARWSFIRYRDGSGELYDLRRDPDELVNLYRRRDHAGVRSALQQVWRRAKDCRGADCRVPLPDSLAADPATVRRLTEQWYAEVRH